MSGAPFACENMKLTCVYLLQLIAAGSEKLASVPSGGGGGGGAAAGGAAAGGAAEETKEEAKEEEKEESDEDMGFGLFD
jgi:large subunit ribosomal protein LP2